MTLEIQVAALVTANNALTSAINVSKTALDNKVTQATGAQTAASSSQTAAAASATAAAQSAGSAGPMLDQVLTLAPTTLWPAQLGTLAIVVLTGNTIMDTPSNLRRGIYYLAVDRDAVAGRTLGWSSAYKFAGGIAPAGSSGANLRDLYAFVSDGTVLYNVGLTPGIPLVGSTLTVRPAPTGLTASGQTSSSLTLTWTPVAGASGYNVFRDAAKVNVNPVTAASYNDSGLAVSTQYNYTVRTLNAAGEGPSSSVTLASTTALSVPLAPNNLAVTSVTVNTITLTWQAAATAASYNIYRDTIKVNTAVVTAASFTDSGLTASSAYAYTVRAVNAAGEGPASLSVTGRTSGASINGITPMPTRVLGGYFETYNYQYNITATPSNFNVIYLFNAQPAGTPALDGTRNDIGDGTFFLVSAEAAHIAPSSIQACRARGQKVILTVGGAGANFNFNTRPRSDNFVASIQAIATQVGGIDGVDFNTFESFIRALHARAPAETANYSAELVYIAGRLKTIFGGNFAITMPPGGDYIYSPLDALLSKALSDVGLLTYAGPQFYEYVGYKDPNVIKNLITGWLPKVNNRQQELMVGLSMHRFNDSLTLAECQRELAAILTLYPNIRGSFGWNIQADLNSASAWSNAIREQLGVGSAVVPPAGAPVVDPTAVTNAFAFGGGVNGAWLDMRAANLRQGTTQASTVVAAAGQSVARIVDRSANDNDTVTAAGLAAGVYRINTTFSDVAFTARMSSASGGGSGQGTATSGFYLAAIVEPGEYYHRAWNDVTSAFTGRELLYDADVGGLVFSVGTGTARVRASITGLGALYTPLNGTARFLVECWHEGTVLSIRLNGGVPVTAACPAFAPGSLDYSISGPHAGASADAIGAIAQSIHFLSQLTTALRDGVGSYLAPFKR